MNLMDPEASAPTGLTHRAARLHIEAKAADDDERTVRVSLSSEEPVRVAGKIEVLDHSPNSVDMRRAKSGLPLLTDHDHRAQIGVVENIRLVGRRLEGVARFGSSALAMERWRDVSAGILRSISVGYLIHDSRETGDGVVRVNRWEPYEASMVGVPADPTVGFNRSFKEGDMPTKSNPGTAAAPKATETAERERVADIIATGRQFDAIEQAERAIREGMPVAEFQRQVLSVLGERNDQAPGTSAGATRVAMSLGGFGGRGDQIRAAEFSISRAVMAQATGDWSAAGLEREVGQEISRHIGRKPEGMYVPTWALAERALLDSGNTGALIGTEHLDSAFIDSLRPMVPVMDLGATMLQGLTQDVSIPRQTAGSAAQWIAEGAAAAESTLGYDSVQLNWKQLSAHARLTRKMRKQSLPGLDELLRNDLRREIAIGLDRAAIIGAGSATEPLGVLNTAGIGDVELGTDGAAVSWEAVTELMAAVESANAGMGSLAFLTNHKVKAALLSTPRFTSGDTPILETSRDGAFLAGYRTSFTSLVPSNGTKGAGADLSSLVYGNWSDLLIGQWGGIDLIVDEYTEAAEGNWRIVAHSEWDIAVRHPESFAAIRDIVTS